MGPLEQGPLSTHDIVSAILCSFSFEVFVRVSTMCKAFRHASFIVAAAHLAIQLAQLRADDGVVRLASHRQQHLRSHRLPE